MLRSAVDEIQDRVRSAHKSGIPLAVSGAGSKRFIGRDIVGEPLDVEGNTGIISYEPTELVISARGGTTIAEIEAVLAENGQYLAAEPPSFGGTATVAGTVAANLSGPGRPWAGSIRDHILGVRTINGRGDQLRFGGSVMKNVAGYDVSRLQAGALGGLGVITEVTLRVQPIPQHAVTLTWQTSAAQAIGLIGDWCAGNVPVSAACWYDGVLSLRLSGEAHAVETTGTRLGGEVRADAAEFWSSVREFEHPFFADDAPKWRFSIRSSALAEADGFEFINWGGAERWMRGEYDLARLETLAEDGFGQVSCFCGGDRSGEVFHSRSPIQQRVHQRLKAAFDPSRILNRGRMYSWL